MKISARMRTGIVFIESLSAMTLLIRANAQKARHKLFSCMLNVSTHREANAISLRDSAMYKPPQAAQVRNNESLGRLDINMQGSSW